jgi:hypothetical protein
MIKQNLLLINMESVIQRNTVIDLLNSDVSIHIDNVYHLVSTHIISPASVKSVEYHSILSEPLMRMPLGEPSSIAIDSELLDALTDEEPIILKMLERAYYKNSRYRQHDLRVHLYYTYLSYWLSFLKEKSISQVIFGNIPHNGYDYIIYVLGKHLSLKVDMFYQLQVIDSYVHSNSVDNLFDSIKVALDALEPNHEIAYEELSARMQKEYDVRSTKQSPFYMSKKYKHGRIMDGVVVFFQKYLQQTERRRLLKAEIIKPSQKYIQQADLTKTFVYFGLHVQPELTTNTLGGRYVNQYLAIQLLAKCLPKGVYLYVKEHPNMYNTRDPSGRFKEFYKMVSDIENVILVSAETNTFELIDSCEAVATITGTVGWEAFFQGKPALVFGNVFYKYFPGIYPIVSIADMQSAIENIFSEKKVYNKQNVFRCLKALDVGALDGTVDDGYLTISLSQDSRRHSKDFLRILKNAIIT